MSAAFTLCSRADTNCSMVPPCPTPMSCMAWGGRQHTRHACHGTAQHSVAACATTGFIFSLLITCLIHAAAELALAFKNIPLVPPCSHLPSRLCLLPVWQTISAHACVACLHQSSAGCAASRKYQAAAACRRGRSARWSAAGLARHSTQHRSTHDIRVCWGNAVNAADGKEAGKQLTPGMWHTCFLERVNHTLRFVAPAVSRQLHQAAGDVRCVDPVTPSSVAQPPQARQVPWPLSPSHQQVRSSQLH